MQKIPRGDMFQLYRMTCQPQKLPGSTSTYFLQLLRRFARGMCCHPPDNVIGMRDIRLQTRLQKVKVDSHFQKKYEVRGQTHRQEGLAGKAGP